MRAKIIGDVACATRRLKLLGVATKCLDMRPLLRRNRFHWNGIDDFIKACLVSARSAAGHSRSFDVSAACPRSGASRTGKSALRTRDSRDSSSRTGLYEMRTHGLWRALLQQDQATPADRQTRGHSPPSRLQSKARRLIRYRRILHDRGLFY